MGFSGYPPQSSLVTQRFIRGNLAMEYIPDGFSKEEWREKKRLEAEANKGKNLGKVGITKFKSRSFEAWQKSGAGHLFPVDPSTPLDKRPYMQRKGGTVDGEDLKKKGLVGRGQARAFALNEADIKYDTLEKEGKLKSTPFTMPWTAAAAEKLTTENQKAVKSSTQTSGKAGRVKSATEEPVKKKGLFGLF